MHIQKQPHPRLILYFEQQEKEDVNKFLNQRKKKSLIFIVFGFCFQTTWTEGSPIEYCSRQEGKEKGADIQFFGLCYLHFRA